MLDRPQWNAEQSERNHYVRFRADYTFDRFVPLPLDGSYRILDYGCGLGHSLDAVLNRFPNAQFVAADYVSDALELCVQLFGADPRVQIVRMTGSTSLEEIGDGFDIILLNAVFEHLLPHERPLLMSDLWRRLKPGGYMVVTETPWRWFPIETHCTSLPLVNYLPDRLALAALRRCGRYPSTLPWSMRFAAVCAAARCRRSSQACLPGRAPHSWFTRRAKTRAICSRAGGTGNAATRRRSNSPTAC
jgi:SAM-dependent methyltransferase